jgi:hypothetical protein
MFCFLQVMGNNLSYYHHFVQVVLLESRDRLGGRILTDYSFGCPVDMGASWQVHFLFLWIPFPALDVINTNGLSVFSSFGALYGLLALLYMVMDYHCKLNSLLLDWIPDSMAWGRVYQWVFFE